MFSVSCQHFSMNVIILRNCAFSSWTSLEASYTFPFMLRCFWIAFACFYFLFVTSFLQSLLLISFFHLIDFVDFFYAVLFGDLDLLLECSVGLSPVRFVFWLVLLDAILFFKILAYDGFKVSSSVVVCDVFWFLSVSDLCFK